MSDAQPRGASAPGGGRAPTLVTLAVALAVGLGIVTAIAPAAAAAVAGALIVVGAIASMRSRFAPAELTGKRFRWMAVAWTFLLIQPIGHFSSGRTSLTAVGGNPSVENVLELGASALIAALALWSLKRNRFGRWPSWPILALPALALLSAAWSLTPTVTLGFSFELFAMALLATLTAAVMTADPALGRSLICRTLRLVVQAVAVLCVVGLIFRSSWTLPGEVARFTWPGTHPLVAAADVGFALLSVVFAGRSDLGFSWPSRIVLMALFGTCLYLGQARTAFAGLLISALFGYWFISRGRPRLRRLAGAAAIALTAAVLVASFSGPITQYLYRGQSQQQVYSLNGRLGLWTTALQQIHSPGRWLVGYGLSGDRVLLASSAWAGDAHSAWLELLLSLGVVGAAVGFGVVVALAARLLRKMPDAPLPSRVLPILFVYLLVMSPVATGFAAPGPEPGLGFALLAFCYGATAMRERAAARVAGTQRVPWQPQFRPVRI